MCTRTWKRTFSHRSQQSTLVWIFDWDRRFKTYFGDHTRNKAPGPFSTTSDSEDACGNLVGRQEIFDNQATAKRGRSACRRAGSDLLRLKRPEAWWWVRATLTWLPSWRAEISEASRDPSSACLHCLSFGNLILLTRKHEYGEVVFEWRMVYSWRNSSSVLSGRFVVPVCLSNLLLPLIFDAHPGTNISPSVATNKLQTPEWIHK